MASAGELTAAEWPALDDLIDLIDKLRGAGYRLSLTHYIAAQDLLLVLRSRPGAALSDDEFSQYLRQHLGPLVCSSPREQADFVEHFDNWFRNLQPHAAGKASEPAPPAEDRPEKLPDKLEGIERRSNEWRYSLSVLAAASLIGLAALLVLWTRSSPQSAPPVPAVADVPVPTRPSVGSVADVMLPPEPRMPTLDAPVLPAPAPAPAPVAPSDPVRGVRWRWVALVLALVPLACWVLWRAWWALTARTFLVREATADRPELKPVNVGTVENELFRANQVFGVARALRQRRTIPAADLDVERTIARTSDAAGFFVPVFAHRQVTPEYLALIDRRTPGDQLARLYEKCLQRLEAQGVFIRRFYFSADPRILFGTEPSPVPVTLYELSCLYADHRLLIFSDGQAFFDPITGQPAAWSTLFDAWSQRAWMLSEPPWSLGLAVSLLEKRFLVEQAGLAGLARVVMRFESTAAALPGPDADPPLPVPNDLLDRPRRWLDRHALPNSDVDRMVDSLRQLLGKAGIYWLATCAVYPEIHWGLTLHWGSTLVWADGAPLMNRAALDDLLRLPWFRYQYMPDWLRLRLLDELPRAWKKELQKRVVGLLLTAAQGATGGSELQIALEHPKTLARLRRPLLRWLGKKAESDSPLKDYVFLRFMTATHPLRLAVSVPRQLFQSLAARVGQAQKPRPAAQARRDRTPKGAVGGADSREHQTTEHPTLAGSSRVVRIFISTPGDVAEERELARRVIEELQQQYYPGASLRPVLWEDLALPATATFQESIDYVLTKQPIDIAVFVLWSRLGTPLGPAVTRPGGEPYRSGTERELDLMLAAFEQSGRKRPLILAYTRDDDAGVKRRLVEAPKSALEDLIDQQMLAAQFIHEHFRDAQGRNLRAYHTYRDPNGFAQRFRAHLREALDDLLEECYRTPQAFEVEEDHATSEAIVRQEPVESSVPGRFVRWGKPTRNKPVVFISATSDLRSARDLVGNLLNSMGYEAAWQEIAAIEGGDLLNVLRRWIAPAATVIQLVGHRYGGEPPQPTVPFGRVSYTQFEALEAERLGKKVIYLVLDDSYPVDPAPPEPQELLSLQAAYRQRLKGTNRLHYGQIAGPREVVLSIHRLRDELEPLRWQAYRRRRNLVRLCVATVVGIAAVMALTFAYLRATRSSADRLGKGVQETTAKLDKQAAEMAELRKALADVAAAVSPKPLVAGQTQPDPIPPELLDKARLLLDRGNAEQRALGMIALKQHAEADRLIQQLKSQPVNSVTDLARLLTLEGDNWYQANEPDKAIGPYEQALALKPNDFQVRNQLARALISARLGDIAAQQQRAIDIYQQTLKLVPPGSVDWAKTQNNLGLAWSSLPAEDKAESMKKAITAYQAALTVFTKDAYPADWARTQENLGMAWSGLPRGDGTGNTKEALMAYQAALTVYTKDGYPADWAAIQSSLGRAWAGRGDLAKAITAYRAALTVYSAGTLPQQRLDTETDLSWVLLRTGDFVAALATASRAANAGVVYLPLEANRAHALLLLGRADEAQAIYLKHIGEKAEGTDKTWEQFVLQDFDDLAKSGINAPELPRMRALFQQAVAAKQSSGKPAPPLLVVGVIGDPEKSESELSFGFDPIGASNPPVGKSSDQQPDATAVSLQVINRTESILTVEIRATNPNTPGAVQRVVLSPGRSAIIKLHSPDPFIVTVGNQRGERVQSEPIQLKKLILGNPKLALLLDPLLS